RLRRRDGGSVHPAVLLPPARWRRVPRGGHGTTRPTLAAWHTAAARDRGRGLSESLAHEPEPWAFSSILLGQVSRVERNRRNLAGMHFEANAQIVVAVYVEMAVRFVRERHNVDVRCFG